MSAQIYGFMRKMTVKQGEATRDGESSVWSKSPSTFRSSRTDHSIAHYELDKFSRQEQLMSYKRRVGPRTYGRKKDGRAALPVLGEGARYEFIDTPEPASPKVPPLGSSPVQSLLSPNSSTADLSPIASSSTRPIRNASKTQRMSAGTLPMPLSSASPRNRRGSSVYHYGPRSVPYESVVVRHAPMDRRQAVDAEHMSAGPVTLWTKMLAATGAQVALDSGYAVAERPIGPAVSNARHVPEPTYVPIQTSGPQPTAIARVPATYASGTKYRALHPCPEDDELLNTFDSIDIHSLASVRSGASKTEHDPAEAASGHTFSYLNDASTGSMSVQVGVRATPVPLDGQLDREQTIEGGSDREANRERSPAEKVRQGLEVKVEDCDEDEVFDH